MGHHVSNPISGEVGAAAFSVILLGGLGVGLFQTPSAGRWVLQPCGNKHVAASFEEFQTPSAGRWVLQPSSLSLPFSFWPSVSNPISGEVGAATVEAEIEPAELAYLFQTPSAGRWVLQHHED